MWASPHCLANHTPVLKLLSKEVANHCFAIFGEDRLNTLKPSREMCSFRNDINDPKEGIDDVVRLFLHLLGVVPQNIMCDSELREPYIHTVEDIT